MAEKLKVLHIWNTAGVGSIIAKYMDKTFGTESWVIMRKRFDNRVLPVLNMQWLPWLFVHVSNK